MIRALPKRPKGPGLTSRVANVCHFALQHHSNGTGHAARLQTLGLLLKLDLPVQHRAIKQAIVQACSCYFKT